MEIVQNAIKQQAPLAHSGLEAYSAKSAPYFTGARGDYVGALPSSRDAKILELGCGDGANAVLAFSEGKCAVYCGIELCESAAQKARERMTTVVVGNVEHLDLPWPEEYFDVLIMSEVLEHLVDPWATLRKVSALLKPGALVFASSPNVCHHKAIRMLIRGGWDLTDSGLMDRTHVRWFTPRTYKALFEACGFVVDEVREKEPLSWKARAFSCLTLGWTRHLFIGQINVRAHRA